MIRFYNERAERSCNTGFNEHRKHFCASADKSTFSEQVSAAQEEIWRCRKLTILHFQNDLNRINLLEDIEINGKKASVWNTHYFNDGDAIFNQTKYLSDSSLLRLEFVQTLHYHELNSSSCLQTIMYRKFCKHSQIYSE